ncbi:MAG: hypothetical protein IIB02_05355 [Thaumarchaeota archaeon]|nr:hypothetical protein [Nitrososphaerota archaeon]
MKPVIIIVIAVFVVLGVLVGLQQIALLQAGTMFEEYQTQLEEEQSQVIDLEEEIIEELVEEFVEEVKIEIQEPMQNQSPPPELQFEKEEPFTKIEIMFGELLNDKLVPVIFTEVTTNAKTLDEIMVWNFQLIDNSAGNLRVVWNALPQDKRIGYEITDDDGQDIRIQEDFISIPFDLHGYKMDCGLFQTVTGESAHPTLFKIKNNTSTIYAQNSRIGIYPDSNGEYSFEFASIFKNYVSFPEDTVEIISQETKECKLTQNVENDHNGKYADGYYTKMTFRFN